MRNKINTTPPYTFPKCDWLWAPLPYTSRLLDFRANGHWQVSWRSDVGLLRWALVSAYLVVVLSLGTEFYYLTSKSEQARRQASKQGIIGNSFHLSQGTHEESPRSYIYLYTHITHTLITYSLCFKIIVTFGHKLRYKIKVTFVEFFFKLCQTNWNVTKNNVSVVANELSNQIIIYTCLTIDIWTRQRRHTSTRFYALWCHPPEMVGF